MKNLIFSLSFLTSIKMPNIEFESKNYKYVPILLGLVGLFIGSLGYFLLWILSITNFSTSLKAIILVIYFVVISGGLHLDGLLDTVDSYFSRKDLEERLRIMHDSNIGAFACIFAVLFFILKIQIVSELLVGDNYHLYIIYIPIFSRLFAGLLLSTAKFATNKGLAHMYNNLIRGWYKYVILIQIITTCLIFFIFDFQVIYLVIGLLIYFLIFLKFIYTNYNGITGDLLGAFIETSELLMLLIYLGVILWS